MEIFPLECFTLWFGLTEVIGALLVILVTVWAGSFRGGFAWQSNPKIQFNWHPLLMTVSMIFLYGNAILIFRAFRNCRKKKLKIAHASVQGAAFILAVIGLQAVFDSHNLAKPPIPNMYSLHSWLGLGAVILFCCQWLTGLITFLYPTLSAPLRASYYPIHVYFGICAFVCAAAAALLGLTEKAIFTIVLNQIMLNIPSLPSGLKLPGKSDLPNVPNLADLPNIPDMRNLPNIPSEFKQMKAEFLNSDYSHFSSEAILVNFIGVTIIIFTGVVVYLVTEAKYKRQPLPEDEMLLSCTEKVELPQESHICFPKPATPPLIHNSNCQGDNIPNFNPEDFQTCELVLECFGEEEETLKIKIDHLHIRNKHH